MKRRHFLHSLTAAALSTSISTDFLLAQEPRRLPWKNWSGSQSCLPEARKAPSSMSELQEIIRSANGQIRPVGAGHSFMPLVPTDGTILSLSRMTGLVSHDEETNQATLRGGTQLGDASRQLAEIGQAFINMPDIDEQSLAGAIATATHGTGESLTCMSDFITGLQLVTADGSVLNCSKKENTDVFEAARVSLGALGIVTEVTMQNLPSYRMKRETWTAPFEEVMETADDIAKSNRNFEFYYIPFSGTCLLDVHNFTDEPPASTDLKDQNEGTQELRQIRDLLSWAPKVRELLIGTILNAMGKEVTITAPGEGYASERNVRFNEMEFHLPRENALNALSEVRQTLESQFPEVFFPIEFRFIKSDDLWLSPFHGRETCSIAVHRFFSEDYTAYFKAIEPIFRKYDGRPHWGKLNKLTGQDLAAHYPRWNDFKAIRAELDPTGKFLNPYLKSIFEIA